MPGAILQKKYKQTSIEKFSSKNVWEILLDNKQMENL